MKSLVLFLSRNTRFSETLIEKNLVFLLYREVLKNFCKKSGISTCDSNYSEKQDHSDEKYLVFLKFHKNLIFLILVQKTQFF